LFNTVFELFAYVMYVFVFGIVSYFMVWLVLDERKFHRELKEVLRLYMKRYQERVMMLKMFNAIVDKMIEEQRKEMERKRFLSN